MDYLKSAVNLCNPKEVEVLLTKYTEVRKALDNLSEKAQAFIPKEIVDNISLANEELNKLNTEIRQAIDQFGSYQDLENEVYGVKQRKVSRAYDALVFDVAYPEYSKAVIIKAVDTTKLNGLIKGNLIKEDELREKGILKETEAYSYIIK